MVTYEQRPLRGCNLCFLGMKVSWPRKATGTLVTRPMTAADHHHCLSRSLTTTPLCASSPPATILWGVVAFVAGLYVALLLVMPQLNMGLPYLTLGRLRPLHTNAAIFAFAGNAIFAAVYYSTQRLCKARMWSDFLGNAHFWGWQLIIVLAAITLPLGITQSKEYAELEWPIDLLIAVVWLVLFGTNFFMTLVKRRERHMYVALWFYIATIVTVTVLHVFNNLVVPVIGQSLTEGQTLTIKSYSVYAGVQDAFMQWWYGHNAVAFFLTTPFLGMMYYFLPKAADRPVFSYKLSIIHFWSLVFIYIWAGPHHLHYTALPEWASSLGMLFSVMLWMPSWGGMINGLLTLRGAWSKVTTDPVLKFFVVGITFYGMSTFEGPLLSVKSVNALSHYTDWTIAHVHAGALGWNGFMTFGMIYWLLPRIFQTKLYSTTLATWHFWIATIGILLYIMPIYWAGITQGLMWRALDDKGGLQYTFLETVQAILPFYWVRVIAGLLYIIGALMFAYNCLMTWMSRPATYEVPVYQAAPLSKQYIDPPQQPSKLTGVLELGKKLDVWSRMDWHRRWEHLPMLFTVWVVSRRRSGFAVRDRADLLDPGQRANDRQGHALHAARASRSRLVCCRRLLRLSLADDSSNSGRDQTLRRVFQAR